MDPFSATPLQERLLAALFIRSHISNRRRRYAAGYMMSELEGVTLSQSEIFVEYRELVKRGFLKAELENSVLLLKLTPEGELYCRQVIYPELLSFSDGEQEYEKPQPKDHGGSYDFDELDGLNIEQIVEMLRANPQLAERLRSAPLPEGTVSDAEGEQIRRAVILLDRQISDLSLPNFEASQVAAYTKVIMVLVDAPATSKKDIAHYAGLVADLITISGALTAYALAIQAYLYARH